MSGIEVAGLLLAVIPLFISAAEHYREGLDAGKRCWNKDRILRLYLVELEFQRVYLVLNLKALLVDVDLDFAVKEALIGASDNDPQSSKLVPALNDAWEQPEVRRKLVERLGEAHDSFVSLLQRVSQALLGQIKKHEVLHDLASIKVSLYCYGFPYDPVHLTSPLKEFSPADCSLRLWTFHNKLKSTTGLLDGRALWRCVKFSWQETERNQMILDLQANNDKLQILLRMLQAAKPFHAERRSNRAKDVFGIRQQVRRMHGVLSQHYHCSHPTHEAKLSLKRGYCKRERPDDLSFETILYHSPSSPRQTTIHINPLSPQSGTRKVRIDIENPDDEYAKHLQQRQMLADICLVLSTLKGETPRFDLVIDEEGRLWKMDTPQSTPFAVPGRFYTLDALLNAASLHRKEPKWLAREKRVLSVILCHSLSHLEGSEWLKRGWRAQTITFVQDQTLSLTQAPRFRLTQPFVSAEIANGETSLITNTQDLAISERSGHPIPSLLNFGIILLELYLNGPLESAVDVEPVANIQLWAMSVLGSCREDKDMEPAYYNAIQFCLWPPWPPAGDCSFENSIFRDDYFQKVVVPLEDALTEGFDFSKEDLATL